MLQTMTARTDRQPNMRHLRAVSEVAALHSITAAAERVFLSQSALTQAIAKLEQAIGCRLFRRHHSGLTPTNEGKLFLQRVNRCLYLLQQGVREALRSGIAKTDNPHPAEHPAQLLTNAQLRALIAIQRAPSYSSAARSLGISQPAIHKAARELESNLNLHLFEPTRSGVRLTEAGENLARFARLALREIELGFDELASLSGEDTTTIAIGVVPLARTNVLPEAINRLTELKPELHISVIDGAYEDLLMQLLSGDIDMMIGGLVDPPPTDTITQLPLFNTTFSLVVRQGHPLATQPGLRLADLLDYRWVIPRRGTPAREFFEALIGQPFPGSLKGAVESGSQIVTRELLAGSDRISLLSSYQIRHDQRSGLLTALDIDLPGPQQTIVLALRKDWHPTPPHLLLISIIKTLGQHEGAMDVQSALS
ncbi:LysR family transcriptional regulator [Natronospirillum operosum]|uniref:LysR family transcriptional regulator n=2 Tax=Natronospirillum operosum TaxID=2759953 RepID=A0A4Z0WBS5_9GAMM|nr:LysR family transcriptional regulator [Natronospirillum operosum]